MRNIKIILMLLIIPIMLCYSQEFEPEPWLFDFTAYQQNYTNSPTSLQYFSLSNFLRGFQWSGTANMNKAMYNNAIAQNTATTYDDNEGNIPIYLINQPAYDPRSSWDRPFIQSAAMMQFEPCLHIDNPGVIAT